MHRSCNVFFNQGDGNGYQRSDFGETTGGGAIAYIDRDGHSDIGVARTGASS
jgi:hypothetical protein